jgi:protein SCO1
VRVFGLLLWTALAFAQTNQRPAILRDVGLEQRLGAQVPLELTFNDESGRAVPLRQYFHRPVVLALVYYQCPSLCNMVLNGAMRSTLGMNLIPGKDFDIVTVSFDPRDTPALAVEKKQNYLREISDPHARQNTQNGWHFLTGDQRTSQELAASVGFHFVYDANANQYAHPSAIMVLTPEGRVSRYFYGIEYPPRDLRLALVEASGNHIGNAVDQVLLYCFHYDPASGKYGIVIMNVLRAGGLLTLFALVGVIALYLRRDFGVRPEASR